VIEREVITFVVSFRGEIERKATEISHQLMQLSIQGAGINGVSEHLARSCNKWVIIEDAEHNIRLQAVPTNADALTLPTTLTDELLLPQGLAHIMAPILIRHEVVGYLSLVGRNSDFDYLNVSSLDRWRPYWHWSSHEKKSAAKLKAAINWKPLWTSCKVTINNRKRCWHALAPRL